MAYIVGSASVEIVPDFRNAQLAITAWFAKQQNELRVPIKPDISPEAERAAEQQASRTGTRVGKAMADATEKQLAAQRLRDRRAQERLGEQMARDVAKATAKAIEDRARLQEKADADALAAQRRLGAAMARDYERSLSDKQRLDAQDLRDQERADANALASQQRLGAAMARDYERSMAAREAARQRDLAAQERAHAQALRMNIRATNEAAAAAARQRETNFRDEERAFQAQLKAQIAAMKTAIRDASEDEKIRLQVEIDKNQAILDARTTGGAVAQAINREIRQNAGLITAAITGALVAGAPLVSAAASGMFIGVAAVGAFQSQKLRSTWVETFDDIRIAGISDTAVLVPAFTRMAGTIGASFEAMRPQIRAGLAEAPVLIDIFSESLAEAAENAMPGLVRSIQTGAPVMRGFGDLMSDLGQGLTDFLDEINEHAPAAGQSFSYLGDSMGELLPTLGELLGEGAELGTIVLPVLTAALGGMRSVVGALGGSLPILATGFLAFRTIQGSGRYVNQFAQSLLNVAPRIGVLTEGLTGSAAAGERMMTGTGRAASGVAALGRALPGIGVAIGAYAALVANGSQKTNDFAQAMLEGGAAARKATEDISDPSAWDQLSYSVSNIFSKDAFTNMSIAERQMEDVREKVEELEASMSPLELAQSRLAGWTATLADRLADEGSTAEEVAIAQRKVAEYSARAAREQEILEKAVRGVTEAMAAQADQARARVDAEFGYTQATLDTQEAMAKYQEVINDTESSAADVAQALLDVNTALRDQAAAAGDRAMERLPASMDDSQRAILGAKASLDELNGLIAMGIKLPPELETWRVQLEGITGEADGAKLAQAQLIASLGDLGFAVSAIPDSKRVLIEAPTAELRQRLIDLGLTVIDLPGGNIEVVANTDEAEAELGNLNAGLADLDGTVAEPTADLFIGPLTAEQEEARRLLANLQSENPTPTADLFIGPLLDEKSRADRTVQNLAGQRPTPTADLNPGPFNAGAAGVLGQTNVLGRQRPTPIAGLLDQASGGLRGILGLVNSIPPSKNVTVTTTVRTINETVNRSIGAVNNFLNRRDGGEIPSWGVQGLAFGGTPRRASGATWGRGGPKDDLVPFWGSPGEHMLDAKDVALMGGQAGVYAFREMLNAGAYSGPGADTGVAQMVSVSAGQSAGASVAPRTPPRAVSLYTPDVPAAIRALKAQEHQDAVLASPWP